MLLCPPDFFSIDYEINPWMKRARPTERAVARAQWSNLRATLDGLGCATEIMPAPPDLPDAVFTANAGLLAGGKFLLSNFRFQERHGEAAFF